MIPPFINFRLLIADCQFSEIGNWKSAIGND